MKRYAVQVRLLEFETDEKGELLGEGSCIDQNIVYTDPDEADARDVYETLEGWETEPPDEWESSPWLDEDEGGELDDPMD